MIIIIVTIIILYYYYCIDLKWVCCQRPKHSWKSLFHLLNVRSLMDSVPEHNFNKEAYTDPDNERLKVCLASITGVSILSVFKKVFFLIVSGKL